MGLDYLNFTKRKMKSFFNFLMLIFHQQIQQKNQLKLTVGKEWQRLLKKIFLTVQGILPHADMENSLSDTSCTFMHHFSVFPVDKVISKTSNMLIMASEQHVQVTCHV